MTKYYTIPVGTIILRRYRYGHPDGIWEDFVTTKEVTYTDKELRQQDLKEYNLYFYFEVGDDEFSEIEVLREDVIIKRKINWPWL